MTELGVKPELGVLSLNRWLAKRGEDFRTESEQAEPPPPRGVSEHPPRGDSLSELELRAASRDDPTPQAGEAPL